MKQIWDVVFYREDLGSRIVAKNCLECGAEYQVKQRWASRARFCQPCRDARDKASKRAHELRILSDPVRRKERFAQSLAWQNRTRKARLTSEKLAKARCRNRSYLYENYEADGTVCIEKGEKHYRRLKPVCQCCNTSYPDCGLAPVFEDRNKLVLYCWRCWERAA